MPLSYVPAGLYPQVFMSESMLYAKFLRKGKFRTEISYYADPGHRFSWLKLYDRDVFLVRNTAHVPDIDFDLCFNMSIFGKDNIYHEQYGLKDVLISAHNGMHELKKWRKMGWRPQNKSIKIIGDSGGAQLRCGTTNYVDPKGVIDWFNDQVDWGAALEIPPRPVDFGNKKLMMLIAEVQKKNNELFAKHRRDDLKLLNVSHGFTLDEARRYCDIVKNKEFNGWAAGADNTYSPVSAMQSILIPHLEYADYGNERLHILGLSGKMAIPTFALAATKIPNLSMDSTNFLRGNRYRRYIHLDLNGKLHEIDMSPKTGRLPPRQRLPCQCGVCTVIGWWDVFNMDGDAKGQHLLTAHNLNSILRYVQFWNVSAQTLDYKEYNKLVKQVLPKSYKEVHINNEYMHYALEHGLDKAEDEFRSWMINDPMAHSMPKLFEAERASNFEKMSTFVGLAQKASSWESAKNYLSMDEIKAIWKRNGIKDLSTKNMDREGIVV